MKTAVVTGANGFIGSHVCNTLAESGVKVFALVNERSDNLRDSDNIVIIKTNSVHVEELSARIHEDIDCFFHFAWEGAFNSSDPTIQAKNISFTCSMVKVAKELNADRFVFSGTVMEYSFGKVVCSDDSQPGLRNLYYAAKQASNLMARTLCYNLGIKYVEAAITNGYGPGSNRNSFMNSVLTKMLANEPIKLTKGLQDYDFIYITDLANAIILLGEKGKANCCYYVGSDTPRRIRDYVESMKSIVGSSSELLFGAIEDSPIGLDVTQFDIGRIYSELGFRQTVDLAEGVARTVEWLKLLGS